MEALGQLRETKPVGTRRAHPGKGLCRVDKERNSRETHGSRLLWGQKSPAVSTATGHRLGPASAQGDGLGPGRRGPQQGLRAGGLGVLWRLLGLLFGRRTVCTKAACWLHPICCVCPYFLGATAMPACPPAISCFGGFISWCLHECSFCSSDLCPPGQLLCILSPSCIVAWFRKFALIP